MDQKRREIVFLGETAVGKTSIILSRIYGSINLVHQQTTFNETFDDPKSDNIFPSNMIITYKDTAGQEQYRSLAPIYVRNASLALLVFDLSREETLDSIPSFIQLVNQSSNQNIKLLLVGNKFDLLTDYSIIDRATEIARNEGISIYAISALDRISF